MGEHARDELDASRHPFETYLLALAAVSGIPLVFGKPNSGSMAETLPVAVSVAWGVILLAGSLMALAGTYWRGRRITGLVLERAGLVGVGGAALVFAFVAVLANGLDAAFSACITAGFGAACFAQARRISVRVASAVVTVDLAREARRHG